MTLTFNKFFNELCFYFFSLVKQSIKISLGSINTPFIVLQIVSCYLKTKQKKPTEDVFQVSFQYRQKEIE